MKLKNFSERGQALIVIAIGAIGLFALVGLAIDGSVLYSDHRHAQNAADTAAVAGALAKVNGDVQWKVTALNRALSNGYDNNLVGNTVTVSSCDEVGSNCGPYAGDGGFVKVVITSNVKTFFAKVVGVMQTHNRVEALSMAKKTGTSGVLYAGSAVASLNTDPCNGKPSTNVYVDGSALVQIWAGGFGSASTDAKKCVNIAKDSAEIHKQDPTCPTGLTTAALTLPDTSGNLKNSDSCKDFIVTSATFSAAPADLGLKCTGTVGAGPTLSPGNWNTSVTKPNNVTKLNPGTYCVTGDLDISSNFSASNVTLVMLTGRLKMNGDMTVTLTAPTAAQDSFGNYTKGLAVYYSPTNLSEFKMDGKTHATLGGTFLAQNSNCSINGTTKIEKGSYQFICDTWQANGNADIQIVYDATQLYNQQNPAQVGLMQ